tara:strand:- start:125 stop:592 length:468 start_codon:yes stop_codon:yes gene_type:complete
MKSLIYLILLTFFTTSCGFKVVYPTKQNNFDIAEITTSGDSLIAYKIKNKLLFNSKKNEKRLVYIDLNVSKTKNIKEKNIKNEITKYEIIIKANVNIKEIAKKDDLNFTISNTGDYNVVDQYAKTLNNEKRLVELLTDNLSDQILDEITIKINAL